MIQTRSLQARMLFLAALLALCSKRQRRWLRKKTLTISSQAVSLEMMKMKTL
jgi:hypothetical protein